MTCPTESGCHCESARNNTVQIEIVPQRILSPETTEILLGKVYDCDGIIRVLVQGSRLPDKVGYGPGTGEKVNHPLKKSIEVEGQQVNMRVTLSRLLIEVDSDETADQIKKICDEIFRFPFEFYKGVFFKKYSTVVDYAKMGPAPDERLLGMTDPKGKLDQIVFIEKNKKDSE